MQVDDLTYNVSFEGTPWGNLGSSIVSINVFQRHDYAVPVCTVLLEDAANYLGNVIFVREGAKMTLSWGIQPDLETQDFRVAQITQKIRNNVVFYEVIGYADISEWFLGGTTKHYDMPTFRVISTIANEVGLQSDVDSTNDKQCWRGLAERRCIFARRLAQRGFIDSNSLMALHTTFDKVLYKNLNAIDVTSPVAIFAYGQFQVNDDVNAPVYPVMSYRPVLRGGIHILQEGYRRQMIDQGIEKDFSQENDYRFARQDRVQIRKRADNLLHSFELDEKVGSLPTSTGILTSGNVHDTYNHAQYQNARGMKLLMTCRIEVLTFVPTEVQIFDPIEIKLAGVDRGAGVEKASGTYDGGYLVYGRIIQISGSRYAEKLLGCRESNN